MNEDIVEPIDDKILEENINIIVKMLNHFEKEYEVKYWDSGGGVDIIIKNMQPIDDMFTIEHKGNFIISINNSNYLDFEYEEVKE